MKRTFKSISVLILAVILLLSMSITAFAADKKITFKGTVEGFDFGSGSEYTSTDLFNFKNVMPGDQLSETIAIENAAEDCEYINLYMKAVVHDENDNPLSYDKQFAASEGKKDETVATMQDFLKQLTMRIYNGTDLIYESTPDQAGALADHVLLGSLQKGEAANLTVELDVPETLGNDYANRVGEVDWVFLAEAISYDSITVHKVWEDNEDPSRPESIVVEVVNEDGEVFAEATLSEEVQWTHTFEKLDDRHTWTVREQEVEGYEVSYETKDDIVFITNHNDYEPPVLPEPIDLSVKKVWADDNNKKGNRPDSVSVTLYNGDEAVEKVTLSEKNNWTYSWEDLDGSGNWSVLETGKVKGYTPSYSAKDGVITITNTATLLQTGQNNLLIWTLGGAGVLVLLCGIFLVLKKRKSENV